MLEPESGPAGACGQCPRPAGSPPRPPRPQAGCGPRTDSRGSKPPPRFLRAPISSASRWEIGQDWCHRLLPAPAGLLASGATLHNGLAGHEATVWTPAVPLSHGVTAGQPLTLPGRHFLKGTTEKSLAAGRSLSAGAQVGSDTVSPSRQALLAETQLSLRSPFPDVSSGQPRRDQCPSWTTGPGHPSPHSLRVL